MNRFSAHMDRSWDMLSKGNIDVALIAARQAREINDQIPEVHNLIGYIYAIEGDFESALNCYMQAIELDEYYLEPILAAAELQSHPDANPDEAIRLCRQTATFDLTFEEFVNVILIEVDANISLGNYDRVKTKISEIEDVEQLPAIYQASLGRSLFDIGDSKGAKDFINRALTMDDSIADVWYCAGLIAREENRRIDAVKCFLNVRKGDLILPKLPWHLTNKEVRIQVSKIINSMDSYPKSMLDNVKIICTDYPSENQICNEVDPRQIAYAKGINSKSFSFVELHVFSLNMERMLSPMDLSDEMQDLIIDEIGVYKQ